MRKLKKSLETLSDNQILTRCKLKKCLLKFKIKEEKLSQTRKEWVEKFVVLRMRRKNLNQEFKVRPKEVKTMKLCSEKLTNKDNKKEEKL